MMQLPEPFLQRMESLLGSEYADYLEAVQQPAKRGIRLNPLKCTAKALQAILPVSLVPAPFSPYGYYIPSNLQHIGSLPQHHAGAFYVQEPSAMSAVTVLAPQPGDKVLDLCAAPGGKSTQIAGLLQGEGLLWSNEIVPNRATVLLSNIERLGISNAVVSNCHPEQLCTQLAGYFDKVLVDAPCSGEGMFQSDASAIQAWRKSHVQTCAVRQLEILESTSKALKAGGILVYSTCTFSVEENETVISQFLAQHPELVLVESGVPFGRPSSMLPQTRRIFPMDGGDGHFVAKLQKIEDTTACKPLAMESFSQVKDKAVLSLYQSLMQNSTAVFLTQIGTRIYQLPSVALPTTTGLKILRAGVLVAEQKNRHLAPCHHLFTASKGNQLQQCVQLDWQEEAIWRYLGGETIPVSNTIQGYCGVAVNGMVLGYGKVSQGVLKNHYPKGLRNLQSLEKRAYWC